MKNDGRSDERRKLRFGGARDSPFTEKSMPVQVDSWECESLGGRGRDRPGLDPLHLALPPRRTPEIRSRINCTESSVALVIHCRALVDNINDDVDDDDDDNDDDDDDDDDDDNNINNNNKDNVDEEE
jgi:hypothetical protein